MLLCYGSDDNSTERVPRTCAAQTNYANVVRLKNKKDEQSMVSRPTRHVLQYWTLYGMLGIVGFCRLRTIIELYHGSTRYYIVHFV